MRKLFRIGPVLMLVPLMLWTTAWNITLQCENQDWYIVWPMVGFLGLAALWPIALVVFEKGHRYAYLAYAVVHVPIFYMIYVVAIIYATHFPL
jgi:hypothetical protein